MGVIGDAPLMVVAGSEADALDGTPKDLLVGAAALAKSAIIRQGQRRSTSLLVEQTDGECTAVAEPLQEVVS